MKIDYKTIPTQDLVDLLAQETRKFTQLLTDKNFNKEYRESKEIIQEILTEIELRKETASENSENISVENVG